MTSSNEHKNSQAWPVIGMCSTYVSSFVVTTNRSLICHIDKGPFQTYHCMIPWISIQNFLCFMIAGSLFHLYIQLQQPTTLAQG